MRILIVGGGIGGFAAAAACLKHRLEPLVLEQAPKIGEVGAGVGLSPATFKALGYLGCDEQVLYGATTTAPLPSATATPSSRCTGPT